MSIKKTVFSKRFFFHLVSALCMVVLIFGLTYKWLASYTKHGSTITVPDIRELRVEEAQRFLGNKSLRFRVTDSTVFDMERPPGTIIEQDPAPGAKVKENRTIYVSITRTKPPTVRMPNLVDVSFRQAEAILQSYGLKMGEITYKPDLCKNCVLRYEIGGKAVETGTEIPKGTAIDFVLGDGFGKSRIHVPALTGLTLEEALFVIRGSMLNVGAVVPDGTVRDTMNAIVYKQEPPAGGTDMISQGEAIDLFISQTHR